MFSFHKPRIYRSASGCCICRAKSSSSRFTDSRRYEGDFYACFKLNDKRTGDICNACVLLVKRWKKLPKGSQRNWHHVVDARAGHGSKPMSKINKVKKPCSTLGVITKMKQPGSELQDKMRNAVRKHVNPSESYMNSLGRTREKSPSGCSDDVQMDCISSESSSYHSSLAASPTPSEVGDDDVAYNNSSRSKKVGVLSKGNSTQSHNTSNGGITKNSKPNDATLKTRRSSDASHSSFLDLSFWKREKTCCGIIFKGPCGEVLLDRRFLSPCFLRSVKNGECTHSAGSKQKPVHRLNKTEISVAEGGVVGNCAVAPVQTQSSPVDCTSVDSGYDDSSNSNPDSFKHLSKNGCSITGKPVTIESASSIEETSSISRKVNHLLPPPSLVSSTTVSLVHDVNDSTDRKLKPSSVTQALHYEPASTVSIN